MSKTSHNLRLVGFLSVVLGYSFLANYTLQSKQHATIGVLIAFTPFIFACCVLAYKSKRRMLNFGLLLLSTPIWLLVFSHFKQHYDWVYWLVHESLQLVLFFTFARTLKPNQQPLCTQFANMVHDSLSPAQISYTRKVTIAWAAFFALVSIISSWLFFFYPIHIWSIFSNFIYLPLVGLMFIVEYIVRIWALPEKDSASIMDAIHAFMDKSKH
jgi:uncharacterized membrane protein